MRKNHGIFVDFICSSGLTSVKEMYMFSYLLCLAIVLWGIDDCWIIVIVLGGLVIRPHQIMQFYKEKLLSPGQLRRLSEHKYSCTTNSFLDGSLQPWWNWLVSKIPLWLAPNLITIVGLIVNIATTLILIYYSPDAKTEVSFT